MFKDSWKFWIIPLALWALYSSWYFGYQSGYSEGHESAWKMYIPMTPAARLAANDNVPDPDDSSDSEIRR